EMNLTLVHSRDYARPVTANSVAGFGDPTGYGATAPTQHQALFLCLPFGRAPATRCLSMADRVGRPSGLPGSVFPGSPTCARLPPLTVWRRFVAAPS
ncbi:ash family protein, partial [Pseudomonas aeruginosa]|nr:ash family protein [Pseudomonas aeruginosa]